MKQDQLVITRQVYEGVTVIPHFPTSIRYQECFVEFDDIYLEHLAELPSQLSTLERTRKGSVLFDGGSRFRMTVRADSHGGIDLSFHAEPINFPGTLILKGSFHIDGEHAAQTIQGLTNLIVDGREFTIHQQQASMP